MAAITAGMVKELREKTGAGMMDCKKALTENDGDMDASIKFLREKGAATADKKGARVAAEGLVGIYAGDDNAALLEVNCETDFVARNEEFKAFVADATKLVSEKNPADVDALKGLDWPGAGKPTSEVLTDKIATIGENLVLRRLNRFEGGAAYGSYSHGGKIGVIVEITVADESKKGDASLSQLARDVAMHVASENPIALGPDDVDASVIENEKDIFRAQALADGKKPEIVEKVVEGRVRKFYKERCLLEQEFVKDPDLTVKKLVDKVGKELGTEAKISRYARFGVGEGIEKKQDNLAEEVAKMTGG